MSPPSAAALQHHARLQQVPVQEPPSPAQAPTTAHRSRHLYAVAARPPQMPPPPQSPQPTQSSPQQPPQSAQSSQSSEPSPSLESPDRPDRPDRPDPPDPPDPPELPASPRTARPQTARPQQQQCQAPLPSPPEKHTVRRLALYAFEALEGTRAVAQLGNWLTIELAQSLSERRAARIERRSLYRDTRRTMAAPGPAHLQRITPKVLEATVVLHSDQRATAVALRFEYAGSRWRATELTVL